MKTNAISLLTGVSLILPAWCDDAADEANLAALQTSAKAYVEAFNKADAGAIALTYLPEAEIELADGTSISGREEIQAFYEDEFDEDGESKAALDADSVRFVSPGVAVENGILHITAPDGEVSSHEYTAVQVKQEDGSWLTASVRGEADDEAPPSAKMAGLDWIIGDWVIQMNDSETTLSFEWSHLGPYIEGTSNIAQTDGSTDIVTTRIGWDNVRKGFVSWSFDGEGGFIRSDWSASGDLKWIMRTRGSTSEGEQNQYTQTCVVDPAGQSFNWIIRDHTIGDEAIPDQVLTAVKRPPVPRSSKSKSAGDSEPSEPTEPSK